MADVFVGLREEQPTNDHSTRHNQEGQMAKGQAKSNKEVRKPKKDKSAATAVAAQGSQVKFANSTSDFGKKK